MSTSLAANAMLYFSDYKSSLRSILILIEHIYRFKHSYRNDSFSKNVISRSISNPMNS